MNMLATGHEPTKNMQLLALDLVFKCCGTKVGESLHSTIGRHAARISGPVFKIDELIHQWDLFACQYGDW